MTELKEILMKGGYFADTEKAVREWAGEQSDAEIVHLRKLQVALEEIKWIFDGEEDIDENGNPNRAMKIITIINKALPDLVECPKCHAWHGGTEGELCYRCKLKERA